MGFSRQEYRRGLPCPPLGIFLIQGLNLCLLYFRRCFFFFFLPLSHRGSPEDSLSPPKFHFLYYVPELLILKALIPSITTRATCMRVLSCPGSELAISRADSASSWHWFKHPDKKMTILWAPDSCLPRWSLLVLREGLSPKQFSPKKTDLACHSSIIFSNCKI